MLAIGIGMLGLQPSELHALTVADFLAAYQGWIYAREQQARSDMERSRWAAFGIARCWMAKPIPITDFLPLPWDVSAAVDDGEIDPTDIEARRERVAQILKRINNV